MTFSIDVLEKCRSTLKILSSHRFEKKNLFLILKIHLYVHVLDGVVEFALKKNERDL